MLVVAAALLLRLRSPDQFVALFVVVINPGDDWFL
jgi:hypothetical protein